MGHTDGTHLQIEARVISLSTSVDRRASVEEYLKGFSVPWRFFDAVRADGFCSFEPNLIRQRRVLGRHLTPNEVGCFKSHALVIQEFLASSEADWLLVLEDDVWVDQKFNFHQLLDFIHCHKIEYLKLYARQHKPARVIDAFGERQLIRYNTDPYGTQAYLLSKQGARDFLGSFQTIDRPIDNELSRFWHNGLDIYALFPYPVIELSFNSTLLAERNAAASQHSSLIRLYHRITSLAQKTLANAIFSLRYELRRHSHL
jgi:glycosyl transferase family 25